MKSFPHFTQHDQMDCGPTCLRMIAAFYGKHYTLNEMREISFITHLGVSMLGISRAAENPWFPYDRCTNFVLAIGKRSTPSLYCALEQQHFVVVYRITQKMIWIADPFAGKIKYSKEEFCHCWLSAKEDGIDTGVALLLEPTPEFYVSKD